LYVSFGSWARKLRSKIPVVEKPETIGAVVRSGIVLLPRFLPLSWLGVMEKEK
jgi:hypothetical protein